MERCYPHNYNPLPQGAQIQRGREKVGLPHTLKLIARFGGLILGLVFVWLGFCLPSDCVLDAGRFSC